MDQIEVPIHDHTTGNDLIEIFKDEYPKLVFRVLANLENGSVQFKNQENSLALQIGNDTSYLFTKPGIKTFY